MLSLWAETMVITVIACKGDDPKPKDTTPDKSVEQLLAQDWTVDKVTYNEQDVSPASFSIKFNINETFEFDTPAVPGLPQSGNWKYIASNKVIRLNNQTDLVVLGQITERSLEFKYTYTNHKMGDVSVVFALK